MGHEDKTKLAPSLNPILKRIAENSVQNPSGNSDYDNQESERKKEEYSYRVRTLIPTSYNRLESEKFTDDLMDKSLFIFGPTGTGKTVLACTIAKRYLKQERMIKYYSFPALIMEFQSSYRTNTENPFQLAKKIARSKSPLILDDIGAEKLTDYVRQMTYYIINEREQWKLITIITSNYNVGQLEEMFDARIASRICGMCELINL